MPDFRLSRTLILPLVLVMAFSGVRAAEVDSVNGKCRVAFRGTSTLHDFHGEISDVPLIVELSEIQDEGRVSATIDVQVRSLTTHHAKRDANMFRMFRSDEHPKIRIHVDQASIAEAGLGSNHALHPRLPVEMTICGVTQRIPARVLEPRVENGVLRFKLEYEVSLTAFGLERPSTMLGAIRVGDIVFVTAEIELESNI